MTQVLLRIPSDTPATRPSPPGRSDPLSRPEVDDLWHAWKSTGDVELRNQLVLQFSPLVKYVAGRVRSGLPRSVDHADLVSEGVIGLIDALDKFDPSRGLAFPTYAVPRIRGAIIDSIRAADWVPRSVRERARDIDRVRNELLERLGRPATDDEVAGALDMDRHEIRTASQPRTWVSYARADELVELETPYAGLGAVLADDDEREMLMPAVQALPERERIVIALYYFEAMTLAEIGRVLGVTESRVSQLRSRATQMLRELVDEVAA